VCSPELTTFPPGGFRALLCDTQTSSCSYSFRFHEDIIQYRKLQPLASQIMVKQTTPFPPGHAAPAPPLAVSLSQEAVVPDGCRCPPWGPPCALPVQPTLGTPETSPPIALRKSSFLLPCRKGSQDNRLQGSFFCATQLYLLFLTCNPIVILNCRKTN